MRAVHDDERVAALFGVNVRMTQVTAFTLGGLVAGIGGAIWAHQFNYVEIQNFNVMLSIFVLLYVLIGGTQTAFGPLVGALFFTLVPEVLRVSNDWRFVFFGVIIVMMMVVRPEGIVTRTMTERVTALLTFRRGNAAKP
jgi:branched-chain amino acid transport system permease protein